MTKKTSRANLRNSFGRIHLGKMFSQSKRLFQMVLLLVCVSCVVCACRKREERDTRLMVIENSCKELIQNPAVPKRTSELAETVLAGWRDKVTKPEPILIHAGYLQLREKNYSLLMLTMSDEDFDVAGFGVKETHTRSDHNSIVVEEKYPVFPSPGIGHAQIVEFQERENVLQRKDEQAWANYVANPDRVIVYRRGQSPKIWIAIPAPPEIEVEIYIYDFAGNESEPVPLEYGTAGRGRQKCLLVTENSE